ncbi:MAG: hypothetical protein CMF99_05060 [Candidatus Marinimicrobia bacterium]|nr:hypothetical protein [Candidatus Neomarinimicrobiota bacterium]|tara:strand:- start:2109 stop:2864 length:756 start_codon:yes stop_codon:yes gene_type:complete
MAQKLILIRHISFIILINLCFIHSQSAIIIDIETRSPLEDVNIFNHFHGTISDASGRFNFDDIFSDNDTISFSLIGYKSIHLAKKDISKVVEMTKISIPIDLVNVYGGKHKFKRKYKKLERDVRKVYPYSKVFSNYLEKYESIMDTLNNFFGIKRYYEKRKIFSSIEDDLVVKYDYSIRKLTKRQGRILIRLIDREANRTSFEIIKDFRNIFTAGFWQFTARIFGHNLKTSYNPLKGEDRIIEYIIGRIET